MPAKKKLPVKGRITDPAHRPIGIPYFVLQDQQEKNGNWTDVEPGWDEWYDKKSALEECAAANKDAVEAAQEQYDKPQVRVPMNGTVRVAEGTDLEAALEEVRTLHKKFNPDKPKQSKRKPFDPASAYPKYRVVARTIIEELLEETANG